MGVRERGDQFRRLVRSAVDDLFDQRSPFGRLALTHVLMTAGDTLFAVSLAGSLFFSISPTAAKSKILLYLLLTMGPFAVVAPALGPLIDRSRGARRAMVVTSALGRAVLCLFVARDIHSLLLFPEAFLMLVLSKVYLVTKGALVPEMAALEMVDVATGPAVHRSGVGRHHRGPTAESHPALRDATDRPRGRPGHRRGRGGARPGHTQRPPRPPGVAGGVRVRPPGHRHPQAGRGPVGAVGVCGACSWPRWSPACDCRCGSWPGPPGMPGGGGPRRPGASRLRPRSWPPTSTTGGRRSSGDLAAFRPIAGTQVILALTPMSVLKGLLGFLTFLFAFGLRREGAATWWFGLLIGALTLGAVIGVLLVGRIRRVLSEQQMLAASLWLVAAVGLLGWIFPHQALQAVVAVAVGAAGAVAKPSFDALVQRHVRESDQGRAFARFETRLQLMWVIGSLVGVVLSLSIPAGNLVLAVVAMVGALSYMSALHSAADRA